MHSVRNIAAISEHFVVFAAIVHFRPAVRQRAQKRHARRHPAT